MQTVDIVSMAIAFPLAVVLAIMWVKKDAVLDRVKHGPLVTAVVLMAMWFGGWATAFVTVWYVLRLTGIVGWEAGR